MNAGKATAGRKVLWIFAVVAIAAAALVAWQVRQPPAGNEATKAGAAAVPVVTTRVAEEDIPIYLSGIGTVAPLFSVTVKVRVDGQLENIAFAEGQNVKAGDLLAQIDPRPFQAQLEQAQAQKARDEAQLKNSMLDLERYTVLWQQDSVAKQVLDTQRAAVEQLKSTVRADQALIETVNVQLGYTTIRAPIGGRTGARLVDAGNIVRAADSTGIVQINQIDPVAVFFTLPEDKFQRVNRGVRESAMPLTARTYAREDNSLLGTGKLTLINNQIDTSTGTFQLKAVFPNSAHTLWPGQYVNVQLVLGTRERALTVPATVAQRGPAGFFAYVVQPDETVAMQPIVVAQMQDGKAIIDKGLAAGTRVVADGQYKLKPGSKISEVQVPATASKSSGSATGAGDSRRKADRP